MLRMREFDPDHEMRVYVSNGSIVHFTLREMKQFFCSWQMWLLVVVGFFILTTGHPATFPQFDSFWLRLSFWFVVLFFYVGMSLYYAPVVCRFWERVFGVPIPLIVASAPLLLASTYLACFVLCNLFEPSKHPISVMSWQMNLRNVLVAHIFETVALLWLIPAQRAERARDANPSLGRKVTLAGRSFDLDIIKRVKSAEHYLEIHGTHGVEVIRERMATFLDQVTSTDGIQTHRSHWVSRHQVDDLRTGHLRLPCGAEVPVARSRQNIVRDWMETRDQDADLA